MTLGWLNDFFFGISVFRKQIFLCLLRGSPAYIFSGLLINLHYVKSVDKVSLRIDILCVLRENKGFGNCLWAYFVGKNNFSLKRWTSVPLVRLKCCCLPGIFTTRRKFKTAIFSNLEPGAVTTCAIGRLTTLFRSDNARSVFKCKCKFSLFLSVSRHCKLGLVKYQEYEYGLFNCHYHSMHCFLPFHWPRAHHLTCK